MQIKYDQYPYPRKIRHHVGTNLYFPLKELTFVPEYYPPLYDNEDIAQYFLNNKNPDILDIGCGKGKFLLELTNIFPNKNILGFEVRRTLVEWAQKYIQGEQIQNALVLWYSVVNGLSFLNQNSVEKAFYLFPDPWPKKKQQNRRLFSVNFLNDLHRVLSKNGALYLATDCDYVDNHHRVVLETSELFNYRVPEPEEWQFPITNKENFCKKKDIPIFRLICEPK